MRILQNIVQVPDCESCSQQFTVAALNGRLVPFDDGDAPFLGQEIRDFPLLHEQVVQAVGSKLFIKVSIWGGLGKTDSEES